MKMLLFTQEGCKNCYFVKEIAEEIKKQEEIEIEYLDLREADGMAEAAFYDVEITPTLILVDSNEIELSSWRNVIPEKSEIIGEIKKHKVRNV
ncbi:MAG: hypothetical protein ACE5K4_05060 [Candidatus Hydrothermarchaeota archaeon]